MRLGIPRSPALTLVLILLTCGIYYLYFIYVVSQKVQDFLEERDTRMCNRVGLPPADNAILCLVLDLVGIGGFASLGLLNPLLQQDSLNRVWRAAGSTR